MKNKIFFVLSLLFGLLFINAGLNKFFYYMPMPANLPEKMQKAMAAFTEIGWIMPLTGAVEVLGGLLIIIPKTRALGAIMILPVMVGILLTNIVQDTSGLPFAAVLFIILISIMLQNKEKYSPLFK
ncbi:DoxX family protein [Flavobacterium sp. 5]|uniref:DoxX family protein n=1 Tax=Flavobacterium sp. 5 TaxID=2035199 RepID=UPI000C2CA3D0|nr:DoxX family protein [Flavobacterium sp. 5]PKB18256.1 DoxX-like protein [Flavobacterium sp. 5]